MEADRTGWKIIGQGVNEDEKVMWRIGQGGRGEDRMKQRWQDGRGEDRMNADRAGCK